MRSTVCCAGILLWKEVYAKTIWPGVDALGGGNHNPERRVSVGWDLVLCDDIGQPLAARLCTSSEVVRGPPENWHS